MRDAYRGAAASVHFWLACGAIVLLLLPGYVSAVSRSSHGATSRISDTAVPLIDPEHFPQRPKPLLELGNPFLGTGNIKPGITLPGGAVWQPSLLVFGTFRSAVQAFHDAGTTFSEWANRLDLFTNLQLSGTERILVGMRPLDEDGRFSGYRFAPDSADGFEDALNVELTTLFFEGDLGELIPQADPRDFGSLDVGFSVGRQPLLYQEGMLINDTIDAIGLTRNTLLPGGGSDLQITFIYGWNNIHRNDNRERDALHLFGVFLAADYPVPTLHLDLVYVLDNSDADDDGVYWGVSSVQRLGHLNTSFRVLGSHALGRETTAVSTGYLLFGEMSWVPPWSHDNVYVNAFWGIDNFASAARGPATGGPLGRAGILFAAVGLGRYGAPLDNRPDDRIGGAIGYQKFFGANARTQLILEMGGVRHTVGNADGMLAVAVRFQQAIGQHMVLRSDLFGAYQGADDEGWGMRIETRFEF